LRHNISCKPTKKAKKANKNGFIIEKMTQKEIKAKLQEKERKEAISWRDIHQYFKGYTIDEVVIVMPQVVCFDQAYEMLVWAGYMTHALRRDRSKTNPFWITSHGGRKFEAKTTPHRLWRLISMEL